VIDELPIADATPGDDGAADVTGGGIPVTQEHAEEMAVGSKGSMGMAGCTRHIET
jgi:hypothetical protein